MDRKPWYREPWPWILAAGPAAVVVAGIITTVLAVTSFDGLVADDYYKQGLAVNRELGREARARALGVTASVQFSPDRRKVRVLLVGAEPASLRLMLVHPTLKGEDQAVALAAISAGVFEGAMRAPAGSHHLHLKLEDGEGRWRLDGNWWPADGSVQLAPQ
jgi:uncharacterized protein